MECRRNSICLGHRLNAPDLEATGGDETRMSQAPDDESLSESSGGGSGGGQHGCFDQGFGDSGSSRMTETKLHLIARIYIWSPGPQFSHI